MSYFGEANGPPPTVGEVILILGGMVLIGWILTALLW